MRLPRAERFGSGDNGQVKRMTLHKLAERAPAKTIGVVAYLVLAFLMLVFGNPLAGG